MTSHAVSILRVQDKASERCMDHVVVEAPLALQYLDADGRIQQLTVTMRTPGHDHELALGFLLAEGLIASADDILAINEDPSRVSDMPGALTLTIHLRHPESCNRIANTRHFASTSSCGLCGTSSLEALHTSGLPDLHGVTTSTFAHAWLFTLAARVEAAQTTFHQTGGLHAAALFDASGTLLVVREDIGRHNALDKVLGAGLQAGWWPGHDTFLFMSSRLSYELVQKALSAQIPVIGAVSAPSSLAIRLAREHGVTLVGFMRNNRFNIYSLSERITTFQELLASS